MTIEHGTPYHLPTDGYFFNYMPGQFGTVEVCLFKGGKGSTPVDKVVLAKAGLNAKVHHQMINQFEVKIMIGEIQ